MQTPEVSTDADLEIEFINYNGQGALPKQKNDNNCNNSNVNQVFTCLPSAYFLALGSLAHSFNCVLAPLQILAHTRIRSFSMVLTKKNLLVVSLNWAQRKSTLGQLSVGLANYRFFQQ